MSAYGTILNGSPTLVSKVVDIQKDRPPVNMISGHEPKDLATALVSEIEKIKDKISGGHGAPAEASNEKSAAVEKAKPIRVGPKVGRNDPCPCGSGKKYKQCCGKN